MLKPDPFKRQIKSPASLTREMQENFDQHFGSFWLEGEVSELAAPFSGHLYFSLKDKEAKVRAVMWKGKKAYGASQLLEGATVLVKGRLSVYAPRGDYQISVDYVEAKGAGALKIAFEKLKAKLAAEGLFAPERKRTLPFWPQKIAVISSPTGAAISDFIKTALELRPKADISVFPVKVQGADAAGEMCAALDILNNWGHFDLLVMTRGGGSLEDLWSFNEEALVRAVARSRTPVVAAIGHSTDETLVELAADQKAITPTAAARLIFRDAGEISYYLKESKAKLALLMRQLIIENQGELAHYKRALREAAKNKFQNQRAKINELKNRLSAFEYQLAARRQDLDYLTIDLRKNLENLLVKKTGLLNGLEKSLKILSPRGKLENYQTSLQALKKNLKAAQKRFLTAKNQELQHLNESLERLSPLGILKRGYALVQNPKGQIVFSSEEVSLGEKLNIKLAQNAIKAQVIEH